eukprot:1332068-Amorphochlora_amoeboformis.AAC.1
MLGVAGGVIRGQVGVFRQLARRHLYMSLEITSNDSAYYWALDWIKRNSTTRHLSLKTTSSPHPVTQPTYQPLMNELSIRQSPMRPPAPSRQILTSFLGLVWQTVLDNPPSPFPHMPIPLLLGRHIIWRGWRPVYVYRERKEESRGFSARLESSAPWET